MKSSESSSPKLKSKPLMSPRAKAKRDQTSGPTQPIKNPIRKGAKEEGGLPPVKGKGRPPPINTKGVTAVDPIMSDDDDNLDSMDNDEVMVANEYKSKVIAEAEAFMSHAPSFTESSQQSKLDRRNTIGVVYEVVLQDDETF